jgi:hypothetical protein
MRFSAGEAEAEAVRLAKTFVAASGGINWTCAGAKPDELTPGWRRRKNVIKWTVVFDRLIGDAHVDGPAVVRVDIETGEATYLEV